MGVWPKRFRLDSAARGLGLMQEYHLHRHVGQDAGVVWSKRMRTLTVAFSRLAVGTMAITEPESSSPDRRRAPRGRVVMPLASPTDRLAHALVYPEQDTKAHRAVTAADLQQLLDPDYEPFSKTTRLPPLPAYGQILTTAQLPLYLLQRSPIRSRPRNPLRKTRPGLMRPPARISRPIPILLS